MDWNEILKGRAETYMVLGDYETAIQELREINYSRDESAQILWMIGRCYELMGDEAKAMGEKKELYRTAAVYKEETVRLITGKNGKVSARKKAESIQAEIWELEKLLE